MEAVKAKKHLGQHFLKDDAICDNIANELTGHGAYTKVLEIGPGMGALTKSLLSHEQYDLYVMDVDKESIVYLHDNFKMLSEKDRKKLWVMPLSL
jgi:16S rRNA (adenine1518-N6/adenine1519-N6)-dimethyltransferase